jgi:hypothetical protein
MKLSRKWYLVILTIFFVLSACAQNDLSSVTQSKQTVIAKTIAVMKETALHTTPSPNPTDYASMTQTALALTPTISPPTPTPTATTYVGATYLATKIGDITIPDGTVFSPGEEFTKTWQITNGGTAAWSPDFKVVFSDGDAMDGPDYVYINQYTPPGQTVTVSVDLVAPETPGTYTGYYLLQTNMGFNFGIGDSGIEPFYVTIVVETE